MLYFANLFREEPGPRKGVQCEETLAYQIFLVGVEGITKFFLNVALRAWRNGVPELANCGEETHISCGFLSRILATTAAMSVHLAVSALS